MNVSLSHDKRQDSCDNELPLPAPVEMAAPRLQLEFAAKNEEALYDTSGNISSVQLA